ncbi:MAG: ABC transporter substrate-binding protein [Prochlorothrix sp.]|nr:ABC transporter substrate-binding protein [Prochlorothrix sp.]
MPSSAPLPGPANPASTGPIPHRWPRWLGGWPGLALVVMLLCLLLGSCSPDTWRSLRVKSEVATVSQIVDSILSDPKTFNYPLSQESPNVFGLIYEGLIGSNGLTGDLEPALAESWQISPDQKTITFTLRPDLRWSDGEPLTVDDVVFTYNQVYFNEAIPTDARDILRVGEERVLPTVKAVGDRQVQVQVPSPFAPLLRNMGLPILPKHSLEASIQALDSEGNPRFLSLWGTDTDPQQIIGNGAYTLADYKTGQRVVFAANPHYWRKDAQGQQQPYIERFVWKIVESRDTQLVKFRSGDLDVAEPMRPEDFPLLKQEEKRGNFTVYVGGPRPGTVFLAFNLNKASRNGKPLVDPVKSAWFNSLAFRQAIAYGIDRQGIIDTVYRGLGAPINSPISVQSPYGLSPEEGLPTYDYNPGKSRELLLGAGFQYNSAEELLDQDGNRVEFTLITNSENSIRVNMCTRIQQDLANLGIKVNFNPIAFNVLVDKLDDSLDWDVHVLGFTGGVEPNSGSNIWQPDGGLHTFNQSKPDLEGWESSEWEREIGRLYIEAAQELDESKRKALYGETQKIAQEQLPFIQLVNELGMSAVRNPIDPIQYSDLSGALWNLYELRVTP